MQQASVRDVAERARVSPGTVSNYLNHPAKVAPETGARIQRAIHELGYVANSAARALRVGETDTIAHLTYEVGNPFFADFSQGVQDRAADHGYNVLIANTGGSLERESDYLDVFESQRVRGLLLSPLGDVRRRVKRFRQLGIPVVLIDKHAQGFDCASVSVDDVSGGRTALEHLLDLGRRRLAFVGGPIGIDAVADRLSGARAAANAAGATLELIETDDRIIRVGREVGARLAEERKPGDMPDGIFAANDLLAIGLLHGLLAAGVRVPDEIAIVGYDDIEFAADSIVPLTTVRRPGELFGRTALDLLHRMIAGGVADERVVFQPELVKRVSTMG